MKIKILGWKCENIRRIGELNIDLSRPDGSVYENTFIMMPNGTGKTTTLELIRAMLTGDAMKWKEKVIRSYRPTLNGAPEGRFCLKVMFDGEIYEYTLYLDYELGEARYETSRVARSGGVEEGHTLPIPLRKVLTSEFVNRFVFDGEQAHKTLDTGSKEAEQAIIYLYQLDKLDELCEQVDKLINIKQNEANSRVTERSVSLLKGKAEKLRRKHNELCREYSQASRELESKKQKRDTYERRYQDIIADDEQAREEQAVLEEKKQENRRKKTESIARIMSGIKKPYNLQMELHMRMQGLLQNMQTLRLPKNVAKEFFRELAESRFCVCGHPIGEKEREAILKNAEEYLAQNEFAVLNEIKTALREYERDMDLEQEKKNLEDILSEEQELANDSDRMAAILADKGNQEIMQVKEAINQLDGEIEVLRRQCERLDSRDFLGSRELTAENNIHAARKKWQEAQTAYEKANGTYVFIRRAEKLKVYISQVKKTALEKLKAFIIEETNRKAQIIIKNDNVQIKDIIGHLIFADRENLSEGQNLAVAYAYIGTLFEHSQNQFPFVVDSPAAALDLNMRTEVATIMPGLFHQMIIFVTSGEKHGFAETYYPRSDVKYYTVKGERDKHVKCFEGLEYFSNSR